MRSRAAGSGSLRALAEGVSDLETRLPGKA